MNKENGGPAFPLPSLWDKKEYNGMTLRDYFAAKAMQGLVVGRAMCPQEWARAAYEMADAMLKEREK